MRRARPGAAIWLLTTGGFYSAVEDEDNPELILVRCRTRQDAKATGWKFKKTPHADYLFRARVRREDWAAFVAQAAMDISYGNFKAAVAESNPARAHLYTQVWALLRDLQEPWWNRACRMRSKAFLRLI